MKNESSRREFIKGGIGALAAAGLAGCASDDSTSTSAVTPTPIGRMGTRPLGQTGHQVALFSLGGQATLDDVGRDDLADQIINRALDLGVNYIDTAPNYSDSEIYIGRVMRQRRGEVFLASKTEDRNYDGALRQIEASLNRLQTDRLDLWQLHGIGIEELDLVFSQDGAIGALERAKLEGMTRFIGISAHRYPEVIVSALSRHSFDAVLMPINAADVHYNSFIQEALPVAIAQGVAVIAMKILCRGDLFRAGGVTSMEQALTYTLTHGVNTAIIGCSSIWEVENNVAIASGFSPYSDEEMSRLEQATQSYWRAASWFKFDPY